MGRGVPVTGFTTKEIRESRTRKGFSVESVAGAKSVFAHVGFEGPRVGKYGVDVEAFEEVALPSLEPDDDKTLVVLDEIGKMELLSDAFRDLVTDLFDGKNPVIATTHAFKHPFSDRLKQRDGVDLIKVTTLNRDALPEDLAAMLEPP
jgi:nucleoside-triphosphatase